MPTAVVLYQTLAWIFGSVVRSRLLEWTIGASLLFLFNSHTFILVDSSGLAFADIISVSCVSILPTSPTYTYGNIFSILTHFRKAPWQVV